MRPRTPASVLTWFTVVFIAACPGWLAQATAQEVPYTGVVIQNQTDARAGAADRFYRVGELNKGQLVRVEEVIVGWYKIVPPQGIYSYISKAFVDAQGDGSSGVVNTDRSKAYAADINGPAGSYRVQAILNEGDGVQIVAEEGSHYKIVAPPNAYVYLPPGSVRRALAVEAAAEPARPEEPAAPEPADEPQPAEPQPQPDVEAPAEPPAAVPVEPEPQPVVQAPTEPPVVPPAETPAEPRALPEQPQPTAVTQTESGDPSEQALQDMLNEPAPAEPAAAVQVQSLAELEVQVQAMADLPLEDRPLDEMIARYEALQAAGGLGQTDAYRVASRLASLRHDREIARGLIAIAKAAEPEPQADTQPAESVNYEAVGRLLASSVYNGKTLPRMYRLADPATGRAVAYIRPGGPVDTTRFLGRLVGVQGDRTYDPALKLKVITVKRIDALQAAD
jgi:hypothetical protein